MPGSRHGNGALKMTMIPSPARCSMVPPNCSISSPMAWWYTRSTSRTDSSAAVSEKAVNPLRSQKSAAISRRWLKLDASSVAITTSATWGEINFRKRFSRSSCSTWD